MGWAYQYTPYIWPMLVTAGLLTALGVVAYRRRSVPGAFPLSVNLLLGAMWAAAAVLRMSAVDIPTKIFWNNFILAVCLMPSAVARFCFVLEYAGLGRWLTRRTLALLAVPVLLQFLVVQTNGWHQLAVQVAGYDGTGSPPLGAGIWILTAFGYLLFIANLVILGRLFFRSPPHRWPVALIICAMVSTHTVFILEQAQFNPFAPLDFTVLVMNFSLMVYAVAIFHFHIFDPIPVAYKTVIHQMQLGMLVLDTSGKIVELNPAAKSIMGLPEARLRGRAAVDILPANTQLPPGGSKAEIRIETSDGIRHYELEQSHLKDRHGALLGHLLLFHDVTAQKLAQAQVLEHQRALAVLEEGERLARELHDQLAQEISFINLQAQTACVLLQTGQGPQAEAAILRLAEIARQIQIDVRELISFLIHTNTSDGGFLSALRDTVDGFSKKSGIKVDINAPTHLPVDRLGPSAQVHLLRITQEALTNIRKHASASQGRVNLAFTSGQFVLSIEDDGVGFDPDELVTNEGVFGVRIMTERAQELGGDLQVTSKPGGGTQVTVRIPGDGQEQQGLRPYDLEDQAPTPLIYRN